MIFLKLLNKDIDKSKFDNEKIDAWILIIINLIYIKFKRSLFTLN